MKADLVILGIKPQMFGEVLPQIADEVKGKGVLSISPGYSLAWLAGGSCPGCHVMRAMPNTPLLVGKGCTALAQKSGDVPEDLFEEVKAVFSSAGEVFVVAGGSDRRGDRHRPAPHRPISSVWPTPWCRPDRPLGLEPEQALRMAALTMEGSARMLLESGKTAGELARQVCSPRRHHAGGSDRL